MQKMTFVIHKTHGIENDYRIVKSSSVASTGNISN